MHQETTVAARVPGEPVSDPRWLQHRDHNESGGEAAIAVAERGSIHDRNVCPDRTRPGILDGRDRRDNRGHGLAFDAARLRRGRISNAGFRGWHATIDHGDKAGLRALLAFLGIDNVTHAVAYFQITEAAI